MATCRRKARIAEIEWERHKETILDLYLTQDFTLNELVEEMRDQLNASASQFEAQLKAWNARKYLKTWEWEAVFNAIDELPPGKQSRVTISGHPVSDRRIQRARRNFVSQPGSRKRRRFDDDLDGNRTPTLLDVGQEVSIQTLGPDGIWSTLPRPHDVESADKGQNFESSPSLPNQADSHGSESNGNHFAGLSGPLADIPNPLLMHLDMSDFDSNIFPESEPQVPLFQESTTSLPQPRNVAGLDAQSYTGEQLGVLSTFGSPSRDLGIAAGPNVFVVNSPWTWLEGLPSKQFRSSLNARGLRPTNANITHDVFGLASPVSNLRAEFLVDTFPLGEVSCGHSSRIRQLKPVYLLRIFDSLVQGSYQDCHDHRDDTIISMNEIEETKFVHTIICSIMNGFAGLDEIPIDRIVRFLSRFHNMQSLLVQALNTCRSRAAQSLAENLFRAAIEASQAQVVTRLLATGVLELNAMIYTDGQIKCTIIERASMLGSLKVIEALINWGVDVNKTYQPQHTGGALNVFLRSLEDRSGVPSEWTEIASVLLKAGAKFETRLLANAYGRLESSLVSQTLMEFVHATHLPFIDEGHLLGIARYFEGNRAAYHISRILKDCQLHHNGECFADFSREKGTRRRDTITLALVVGAIRGSSSFVKLLLPCCESTQVHWVLSASIKFGRDDLIEHVLETNPDIERINTGSIGQLMTTARLHLDNSSVPPPHYGNREKGLLAIEDISSSPLAEAILSKNEALVCRFEQAGPLAYPGDGGLGPVIAAASKIGDEEFVRKLLSHYPYLPPDELTDALYHAIRCGNESIAWDLLNAGADVNETTHGSSPLEAAIEQKNSRLARGILSADISENSITFDCLMGLIRWGDRSMIADFITITPYLAPDMSSDLHRAEADQLAASLGLVESDLFDHLLDSVFLNRDGLNVCLKVAIRKRDNNMIGKILERGADPLGILDSVMVEYPDTFSTLLTRATRGIQPVMNGSGRPALKAAIEGGLHTIEALDSLLRSGLFDLRKSLFLHGPQDSNSVYSPLGLAIEENESYHDPNFSVIKRLLKAGCVVNSVAKCDLVCMTTLLLAIEKRDEDLVQLLINNGADVNAKPHLTVKQTPLQCAAAVGSLSIVRLLLNHGVGINAEPAMRSGGTALQYAARSGSCNVAAELLARGALLYAPPSKVNGRWPLEGAAENGRLDMIQFLWKAHQDTITLEPCVTTGFEPDRCRRAMQLAEEKGHLACRGLIADLSKCAPGVADAQHDVGFCG
ncbi:hypothetical protein F5Y05DRAFT_211114 [Hypoxylon sp. FL0543]|nr:hypothetical protein F5Y05DRAFT_211114 [Hypoxylon sp. FL0543]